LRCSVSGTLNIATAFFSRHIEELKEMSRFVGMSVMTAAFAAAALLVAPPAQAVTAVLQPHMILLDQADQASTNSVVAVRSRGGFGGSFRGSMRGGSMMWRRGSMGGRWGGGWRGAAWGGRWHGGNWGNRWHGGRWAGRWHGGKWNNRWYRRGWGYRGWGVPWGFGGYYAGSYGGACGYGYRWTYRWGCVPVYGYGFGYY
jgi:hypothetical protein